MKISFLCSRPKALALVSAGLAVLGSFPAAGMLLPRACAEPPTTVESQTAATAGKAVLVVSDNNKTQTLAADGQDVNIDGNNNIITVTGKCHALTVSGNNNAVRAEAVVSISTPGNENKVSYAEAADGEKAQITDLGSGNSIGKSGK